MTYVAVLTYTFAPSWLALSRDERNSFEQEHVHPLFEKVGAAVQATFVDAEAFSARPSDFVVLQFDDLQAYYFLIEAIRDSQLIAKGYAQIEDVLVGIKDGYRDYEAHVEDQP